MQVRICARPPPQPSFLVCSVHPLFTTHSQISILFSRILLPHISVVVRRPPLPLNTNLVQFQQQILRFALGWPSTPLSYYSALNSSGRSIWLPFTLFSAAAVSSSFCIRFSSFRLMVRSNLSQPRPTALDSRLVFSSSLHSFAVHDRWSLTPV